MTNVTVNEVSTKAEELMQASPAASTTTLEIKEALRNDGLWATQYEVAQSMYAIWALNGWHWTFNGTYRTYYPNFNIAEAAYDLAPTDVEQTSWLNWLPQPVIAPSDPNGIGALPLASAPSAPPSAPPVPDSFPEETDKPSTGDWLAFAYDGGVTPIFVTGVNHTDWTKARNIARNFYSAKFGVAYADVGANAVGD